MRNRAEVNHYHTVSENISVLDLRRINILLVRLRLSSSSSELSRTGGWLIILILGNGRNPHFNTLLFTHIVINS